jgi:hypothetical protein
MKQLLFFLVFSAALSFSGCSETPKASPEVAAPKEDLVDLESTEVYQFAIPGRYYGGRVHFFDRHGKTFAVAVTSEGISIIQVQQ